MVKIKGSIQKLKDAYRAHIEKQFVKLDLIDKKTPDDLYKEYRRAPWGVSKLKKKAYKGYAAYYKREHPNWVSSIPKSEASPRDSNVGYKCKRF